MSHLTNEHAHSLGHITAIYESLRLELSKIDKLLDKFKSPLYMSSEDTSERKDRMLIKYDGWNIQINQQKVLPFVNIHLVVYPSNLAKGDKELQQEIIGHFLEPSFQSLFHKVMNQIALKHMVFWNDTDGTSNSFSVRLLQKTAIPAIIYSLRYQDGEF